MCTKSLKLSVKDVKTRKEFDNACNELNITHYHIYSRTPKMNAHIERFNRTISDGFISMNRMLLAIDIHKFNKDMIEWLLLYNTERLHQSLEYIIEKEELLVVGESNVVDWYKNLLLV